MAATRHEARGTAREPNGGTPRRSGEPLENTWEQTVLVAILLLVGQLSGSWRVALASGSPYFATSIENDGATK